ncbi:penicillin-binding protein [Bacillus canaveralius]|uniref:serine-type D-Ala-D-Ala carboxypeptidase n=2 Tax=Bacillus canaveralius TaxID=1403243 RepID=A0A2N5GR67_9BACI|nr:penicillin-binding protein 2 [Bacillus canaveralius]PLR85938.1 penicillin-binding protein [Bacillus canaveralius]PLS00057.1 penicillin-binding protein [Bacillus canaveralius]
MNKKKKKTHVPFRLNMLFFAVFLLFSLLILRLGVVQIVYGDDYKREIARTEDKIINNSVPRGKMFDRNGKVIVDNTPLNAITYTKYQGTKQQEILRVAENLAQLIDKDTKKIRERDRKDFWIMKNPDRAAEKITDKEQALFEGKELTDKDLYKLQLERITEDEINEFSNEELEVLAIYRELSSGYALTPQIVKNEGVTPEEFAVVSENLEHLPGVDTTTDWDRYYAFGDTLKSVLGKVSDADKGLPEEQLDYYLSRDYNRNDRVGISYIEQQYEDVLHGQKAKVKNITDKAGNVLKTEIISEGQRGKDLVLSTDMDLQLAVEKAIEEELWAAKGQAGTTLLDRAYVVMMDPNTGEILSMAGKRIVKNEETGQDEMQDDALGNITTTYNVGSAVKGATILTGYQNEAIAPGTRHHDAPMYIRSTPVKKSWTNMGTVDDLFALKRSSNVYMFKTAVTIGGGQYIPQGPLKLNTKAFDTIRDSFSQFGLGVRTGIDLPNETIGFKGMDTRPGFLLDLVIGQYDTYSNMMLAQYVSTIANGGHRLEPHLVKQIREPVMENNQLGPVMQEIKPKVLNKLPMKEEWIERVQEGFRQVVQEPGGTAYSWFPLEYLPAGKTGTAEAFYDGPLRKNFGKEAPEVMNLSFVGYAPHENPEVAIAVLVPWAFQGDKDHKANLKIGKKAFDAYFNLKKQRVEQNMNQANPVQLVENIEEVQAGQEIAREVNEQSVEN